MMGKSSSLDATSYSLMGATGSLADLRQTRMTKAQDFGMPESEYGISKCAEEKATSAGFFDGCLGDCYDLDEASFTDDSITIDGKVLKVLNASSAARSVRVCEDRNGFVYYFS